VSGSSHRTIESNLRQGSRKGIVLAGLEEKRKLSLNVQQKKVLNRLFSGFEGKLTRDKWMKITKASSPTALRDIEDLIAAGVIEQEDAGGRSTSYRLNRTAKIRGQD